MAKARYKKLTIKEISAVDNPAQEGARVVIMKRHEPSRKSAGNPEEKGDPMPQETEKDVAALTKSVNDLTAKVNELTTQNADLQIDASLTDADKEHVKSLDAETAKAFKKKAPAERARIIAEKANNDETIEVDGRTIRKSVVGGDMFAVVKSQQAALKATQEATVAAQKSAETAELKKRAGDDLAHLPGVEDDKVEILRSMKAMPEKPRAALEAILKAADKMAAGGFEELGADNGQVRKTGIDFEKRVDEVKKSNPKLKQSEAMAKARDMYPDEFEAYQEAGNVEYIPPATRRANAKRTGAAVG